ncbi:unnamed protein product [Lampetra planeri]
MKMSKAELKAESKAELKAESRTAESKGGGGLGHHFAEASFAGQVRCSYCNRPLGDDAFECQCGHSLRRRG